MQQTLAHLDKEFRKLFEDLDREALLAAALLHDVGHSPLSHATEDLFGKHEDRSVDIILDSTSQVNKILKKKGRLLPKKTASLIAKPIDPREGPSLWQKSLISSQLDMDRLDYLKRDSLCSGAEYGNYDVYRIIHTMKIEQKTIEGKGQQKDYFVVWPDKTKYALEEYIFSRFYMYQSVYFHHTTKGFEGLLVKILRRAQELSGKSKMFKKTLLPPVKILLGGRYQTDLSLFQKLNDHVLLGQITLWQNERDKIISDLSRRLMTREVLGWYEYRSSDMELHTDAEIEVRAFLENNEKNWKYYLIHDKTSTSTYKPYSPTSSDEGLSSEVAIILHDKKWGGTGLKEISEVPGLERLAAITTLNSRTGRLFFPKEHEREIKGILQKH